MKECEYCVNSTIADWDWDEKNKKSIPDYWCEKHKRCCEDIYACEDLDTGGNIFPVDLNKEALKEESELWHHC